MNDIDGKAARVAVEPSGSERDTMNDGVSDMAGKAVRVAVERSGSERDTMLLAIIEPAHSLR